MICPIERSEATDETIHRHPGGGRRWTIEEIRDLLVAIAKLEPSHQKFSLVGG
jgi:hypothetical protein